MKNAILVALSLMTANVATAQIVPPDPGAVLFDAAARDASDTNPGDGIVEIDLASEGFYDAAKWCVIFSFTDVIVQSGITVSFKNHPANPPVVWLVQGNVVVDGRIKLDAEHPVNTGEYDRFGRPGPGGFRGGKGHTYGTGQWVDGSGLGPGGGFHFQGGCCASDGSGGSYATLGQSGGYGLGQTYGNPGIAQLIGGSGGAARRYDYTGGGAWCGGGGGGAMLIAANQMLSVEGSITAWGGAPDNNGRSGSGGGGAIRLVANDITIGNSAQLIALGHNYAYDGGAGRIRLEAATFPDVRSTPQGNYSIGMPSPLFPFEDGPTIEVLSIGGMVVPEDPQAGLGLSGVDADVCMGANGMIPVVIRTNHILGLGWEIWLRVTRAEGSAFQVQVTDPLILTGNPLEPEEATVTTLVDLQNGYTAIQAWARAPQR